MPPAPTLHSLPPELAWKPLPFTAVNTEVAAHLLRRMGFSATPDAVKRVQSYGLEKTIQQAFSEKKPFEKSEDLAKFQATAHERYRHIYKDIEDVEERRKLQQELRREENDLFESFALQWFDYARQFDNSAQEKFVLFLQDVFVVERQTVRETVLLFDLQQTLRSGIHGRYPELCKAVSREPAMVRYLNLNENTAQKPNENFARELFELFTLGEGNGYTEQDIKEASRAFTGYRVHERFEFLQAERQYDKRQKTVFGQSGNWDGDDVIDLTFEQPAARTYLIREFLKFYLSNDLPDDAYITELGDAWAAHNFEIMYLVETIFHSRLFHHPYYRGNYIKSPTQFYLGLCQDLQLDIVPFEGRLLRSMSAMGQTFYDPPNVRGWLYGGSWINSTTISARRQLVDYLFSSLNEKKLNGNEQKALEAAKEAGKDHFLVTDDRLNQLEALSPDKIAEHITTYFITPPSRNSYAQTLQKLLVNPAVAPKDRIRFAVIGLLQSPAYNLC